MSFFVNQIANYQQTDVHQIASRFFPEIFPELLEVGETGALVHPTGERSRPQTAVGHLLHRWLRVYLGTSRAIAQDQQAAGLGVCIAVLGPKKGDEIIGFDTIPSQSFTCL